MTGSFGAERLKMTLKATLRRAQWPYFTLAVSSFVVSCKRPVLTGRGNESEAR